MNNGSVKAKRVSSDSSSSSDEDDGDWNEKKKSNKSKAKPKKVVKKSVKIEEEFEEKEEGEVEDDDEDVEEFNDGYDENLMGDEDDQKRLSLMTEKEREQELFNRSEKREVLKTRFEIEKKLRMAKKKELNKSQTDASQRSTERRRNLEDKRKVKDAIKDLKQIREKKKEKLKHQQRLRAADVYSSDSDSDDDKNAGRKSSSSSTSSSSSSDDSDDEKPNKSRNEYTKKDDDDIDDGQGSSREEEVEAWNLTIDHLNSIRLSRHKMEKWCHSPFFKETVINCFVRIGIGLNPKTKENRYIVAQISDVVETPKVYNLGKTRTNKGIKLRHARQTERIYRLEFVSDSPFQPNEYQQWVESMEKDRCELPSKEFIERKKRDIMNACNFSFTEADIESIVQEKERFNNRPVNYAMKKNRLLREKEMAEMCGDNEKVERILLEIDELEVEAKKLDKKRTQNIAAISYINERNRMRNIMEAEKALVEQSAEQKKSLKDDPFTRRKCTPTMIHMFNKNKVKTEVESVAGDLTEKIDAMASSTPDENGKDAPAVSEQSLTLESPQKSSTANERPVSPGHQNDLFSAHNFDIKIDFDVDIGIPSASSANNFSNSSFSSNNSSFIAPKPANRRSLNLDEYKKKKGLI